MSNREFFDGACTARDRLNAFMLGEKTARFPYIRACLQALSKLSEEEAAKGAAELRGCRDRGEYVMYSSDHNPDVQYAYGIIRAQWTRKPSSFAIGFVYGLLDKRHLWPAPYNTQQQPTEEPTMASEGIFHPHTVTVTVPGVTTNRRYQFDPAYFELKKGDNVVVQSAGTALLMGVVEADPEPYSNSTPLPLVVDRVDMTQFEARKERQANIDKARLLLKEAAKRNTEQDLFNAVKSKLSPEELAFIAGTLGLGTEKPDGEHAAK